MAYRAEIEIGVRGLQQLQALTKQIDILSAGVDSVSKRLAGATQSISAYNTNLAKAAETLNKVNAGTIAEADAVRQYVQALGQANAARDRQNKLIQQQIALQRQAVPTANAGFGIQGPQPAPTTNPRSGGPGRFSNVVLGAGFPLLFGGGPGSILGGAAGGLVGGPSAFAAQIGLSALGQQLDKFAASAAKTGAALSPLTADVDTLSKALGITGTSTATYIAELQKLERQDEALAVATEEMARLVGDKGVQALRGFGEAATDLSNEWTRAMTQMQAALAGLLAGPLRAFVNQLESANLLRQAQASSDPRIQQLIQLRNRPGILGGTGNRSINEITAEIIELQRKANIEAQKREQLESATAGTLAQQKRALEAQLDLAYTDGDLTNDKVFNLAQIVISKEFEVKLQQALNNKTDLELVRLEEKLKLQQLAQQREQALAAAAAKTANELERQRKEQERTAKLRRDQLSTAQKNYVIAEANVGILTAVDELSKAQAEFDKARIERMYTFSDLLNKSLSAQEADAIVQTQYLEILTAQINLENTILDIQKRQTEELYNQLDVPGILDPQVQKGLRRGASSIGNIKFDPNQNLIALSEKDQAIERTRLELEKLLDPITQVTIAAEGIGSAFSTSFTGIVSGTMTAQEALANFFKNIADQFLDMAAQIIAKWIQLTILNSVLKLFPSGPATGAAASGGYTLPGGAGYAQGFSMPQIIQPRAMGGPVSSGSPYIVGERGPELFVPGRSGTIVPNDQMGGSKVEVGSINISVENTGEALSAQAQKQIANQVQGIVMATLVNERRSGGVLR